MDPSIMKLLEEDEDESMHSGADVEAFTAALNRDIESRTSGVQLSQPQTSFSQERNQSSSQMYSQWQPSNQHDNSANQPQKSQEQLEDQLSSKVEVKEHSSSTEIKQEIIKIPSIPVSGGIHVLYRPMQVDGQGHQVEQNSGQYSQPLGSTQILMSGRAHPQIPEQDRMPNPGSGSQLSNTQRLSNNQPVPVQEQAGASTQKQKQIPFGSLLPIILPELDKEKAMQLQTLYTKLRRNEIPKDGFVRHMRTIVGDQMLRLAVVKMQAKSQNPSPQQQQQQQQQQRQQPQPQPQPQQQQQQQQRLPPNSATQFSDPHAFGQLHQKTQTTHPVVVGGPAHGPTVSMQPHQDSGHQIVGNHLTGSHSIQANQLPGRSVISVQGFSKQQQEHLHFSQSSFPMYANQPFAGTNVQLHQGFGSAHGGSTSQTTTVHHTSGPWPPVGYVKQEPTEHGKGSGTPHMTTSSSVSAQMDTAMQVGAQSALATNVSGIGGNSKMSTKKPIIGQKKPLDSLVSSPPLPSKKQKVSGGFADQSIEHLNDVTAVSGVNLREEEEQLFSIPKDDGRVSEASRKAVQEEEDRVILQKLPLQKKLAEIMTRCGLKNLSNDVERCLSLCVEERLRALISNLIRVSKQRVDSEKSKHSTRVTSDVREQILMINQNAREEWEKKQAEADKLRKQNEPDSSTAIDVEKEKEEARNKSLKVNKEEDDKMRTTAANVAARAAAGGDDMLSKWQLMAQARQKRDGGPETPSSQICRDANPKPVATSAGNVRDTRGVGRKDQSAALVITGMVRQEGRNQVSTPPPRVGPSISIKDVIAVLEREPQMAKSTLVYRLYNKVHPDV